MTTIPQLPAAGPINPASDLIPISQSGVTYATTASAIAQAVLSLMPVPIPFSYTFGLLLPGQALFNVTPGVACSIPAGFAGSTAICGGAPTNALSLPIIVGGTLTAQGTITGGTQVGTVNYAAGATMGTFALTNPPAITATTTIGIEMTSGGDATFANPAITLLLNRAG